jgi:hypothetical protein
LDGEVHFLAARRNLCVVLAAASVSLSTIRT